MDTINKKFSFENVPPVFKRGHQVMLAIFDRDDRLFLSRKHAYPVDIYRLFGGGIEAQETAEQAAARELEEETGLSLPLKHRQRFSFTIEETSTGTKYSYKVDLFYIFTQTQQITPGDDVNGMKIFLQSDLEELLTLYEELPPETFVSKDQEIFSWADWAAVFNEITKYVLHHWPKT
jgi:8-oxo-dGTP pyrophosphatase MutT (NUDIX family)